MLKKVLKDRSGSSHVMTAIICLVIAMIFAFVFIFARAAIDIRDIKDQATLSLDNFTTENSTGTAILVRYLSRGKSVLTRLDYTSYINELETRLNMVDGGDGNMYRYDGEKIRYYISAPVVTFVEPERQTLRFNSRFTVFVPLRFMGAELTARVPITVSSYFRGSAYNTARQNSESTTASP